MIENLNQTALLLLSGAAIWLVSRREGWSRWGYIAGLASQPFWLWSTFHAGQWGIFAVSVWYTYAWCQGIYNYWLASSVEPADEGGYW